MMEVTTATHDHLQNLCTNIRSSYNELLDKNGPSDPTLQALGLQMRELEKLLASSSQSTSYAPSISNSATPTPTSSPPSRYSQLHDTYKIDSMAALAEKALSSLPQHDGERKQHEISSSHYSRRSASPSSDSDESSKENSSTIQRTHTHSRNMNTIITTTTTTTLGSKRKKDQPFMFNSEGKLKVRRQRAKAAPSSGELFCRACGETQTCEWRRGPDGYKSLCNACGIHYAKIVKKEENASSTYKPKSISLNMLLND